MSIVTDFKLARIPDALTISRMARDYVETGPIWRWTPARVAHHIRCPDSVVLMALHKGRILGFAIMYYGQEEAHLLLLAVVPGYRRRQVGRGLVEWLEKTARVAGIETVLLEVREGNREARRFYRYMGYRQWLIDYNYYDDRENAVKMAHDLRVKSC